MVTTARIDRSLLPSISMLAAFDATARTGSFSAAARELNLTHGAVSRQVSALEHKLGVALFERSAHGESLTGNGELYAREIRSVLTSLQSASLRLSTSTLDNTLNLAITSTFGTRWLIPRIAGFIDTHPEITVNFVTRLSPSDIGAEGIDAAIHYGVMDRPGTESVFLTGDELVPVCAAALLPLARNLLEGKLRGLKLLHVRSRADAWDDWFAMVGIEVPTHRRTLIFEQFSVAAQAAVAGLGVAMLPQFLIGSELERGELVRVADQALASEKGLYLVTPDARKDFGPVVAFRKWLLETIERARAETGRRSI